MVSTGQIEYNLKVILNKFAFKHCAWVNILRYFPGAGGLNRCKAQPRSLSSISTTQQSRPVRAGEREGTPSCLFYPKEGWKNGPHQQRKHGWQSETSGERLTGESFRSACDVGATFCGCRSENAAVRPGPRMTAANASWTAASPVVTQRFHVTEPVSDGYLLRFNLTDSCLVTDICVGSNRRRFIIILHEY